MKKIIQLLVIMMFMAIGFHSACFAYDDYSLRNYSEIEVPKGTFIPVLSRQDISTLYCDEGSKLEFTATTDLYLYETNIIPKNTIFYGYVEKINEPIIGTHASMKIKIVKLALPDGFEVPVKGYIHTPNANLIGGGITEPTKYIQKPSYKKGFKPEVGFVPGGVRKMGEHISISAGADLLIVIDAPIFITHTVIN